MGPMEEQSQTTAVSYLFSEIQQNVLQRRLRRRSDMTRVIRRRLLAVASVLVPSNGYVQLGVQGFASLPTVLRRYETLFATPSLLVSPSDEHYHSESNDDRSILCQSLTRQFLDHLHHSLQQANNNENNNNDDDDDDENTPTMLSFCIYGPSKPKTSNHRGITDPQFDALRGSLRLVSGRWVAIKKNPNQKQRQELLVQVTFKYHGATDIAKNWKAEQVVANLQGILGMNKDMDKRHHPSTMALPASEWGTHVLIKEPPGHRLGIQRATLETTTRGVWELDLSYHTKRKAKPKLVHKKVPTQSTNQTLSESIVTQHDRTKQVPIDPQAPFLQALGLINANGKPKPKMASKYKQCQKFVQVVDNLIAGYLATSDTTNDSTNPTTNVNTSISIVDMGCGRGYLTFSLHDTLAHKYGTHAVQSQGIDFRPKLVQEVNEIASSLGPHFAGLSFAQGTIQELAPSALSEKESSSSSSSKLNVLIALHACDTATDDALWSAISQNVQVIVVAPCCHRQLRPQLNQLVSSALVPNHPLKDMLRHGIYRERFTEQVTDSIRALLLEIAGYSVQVFEFIGGEHTSKNCMITAVQLPRPMTTIKVQQLRQRLVALATFYGIQEQKLAHCMGESLTDKDRSVVVVPSKGLDARNMPPL